MDWLIWIYGGACAVFIFGFLVGQVIGFQAGMSAAQSITDYVKEQTNDLLRDVEVVGEDY